MGRSLPLLPLLLLSACPGNDAPPETSGSEDAGGTSGSSETTNAPTTTAEETSGSSTSTGMDTTMGPPTTDSTSTSTTDASETGTGTTDGGVDRDMDGFPEGTDCNDDDPMIHPGAPERCNGVDDDCDPMTTEDGVVSVDGEGSYPTVGDGVAVSMPGSEVRICPGTYVETVAISHDLQLISSGGPAVTTIDANNGGPAVSVSAGTVGITGLTLTGGSSMGLGGGLSITGTDPVTVTDCLVAGNQSSDGAGIYTYSGAQLTLEQTTVSENLGEIGGGLMFQGASLTISQCTIADNIATEVGGGMVIFGLPTVQIDGTSITDNLSPDGGGLAVEAATITLQDCTIERNEATATGGGLLIFFGSPGTVTSSNSNWGTGMDDNAPEDVFVGGAGSFTGYGAGASFSCSAAGCM